jgi:hypothetical protein
MYPASVRGTFRLGGSCCLGALLLYVAGCGGGECELGDARLQLTGVQALEPGSCAADGSGATRLNGVLDRLLTDRYLAALKLENPGEVDIAVRAASVSLSDTQRNALMEFTGDAGGLVKPGEATSSLVTVIPSPRTLPNDVYASIVVEGERSDGKRVQSQALTFAIRLCDGCLIDYAADADDTAQPGYQCVRAPEEELVEPCLFGQDDMVDCRQCAAVVPECLSPQ